MYRKILRPEPHYRKPPGPDPKGKEKAERELFSKEKTELKEQKQGFKKIYFVVLISRDLYFCAIIYM